MSRAVDFFLVYSFVKRLATPFKKWPAYKLGIIDENGKVLRKSSELTTKEEIKAWGYYDIMLANLKKLLAKLPGGSSPAISMAAAMALLKEGEDLDMNKLVEELTTTASTGVDQTALAKQCKKKKKKEKTMKRLKEFMSEEVLMEGKIPSKWKNKLYEYEEAIELFRSRVALMSTSFFKEEMVDALLEYIEKENAPNAESLYEAAQRNPTFYLHEDFMVRDGKNAVMRFYVDLEGEWFSIDVQIKSNRQAGILGVARETRKRRKKK